MLDELRGFAMFGVLWSNLNGHYGLKAPSTALDFVLAWAQPNLIEFRFYSLLGFLFGIGFALQIARAETRGASPAPTFLRRMAALLALGVIHGTLIWGGDVLTEYALLGFVLILFRHASPARLLAIAAFLALLVARVIPRPDVAFPPGPLDARFYWIFYRYWFPVVAPQFLALFLLGLCLVRSGLLPRLGKDRRLLLHILVISAAVSIAGRALEVSDLRPWSDACVYATLLALFPIHPLAAAGRMSLTVYLTQSLISIALFRGLGWYGHVGYTGMLAITVAIFTLQVIAATLWFRRFQFGPVEYLWRRAAYL